VKPQKQCGDYVREPAIATPDRNIEDQVELLIEGCILVWRNVPRICQFRPVFGFALEVAALPEIFFPEVDVENLLKSIVNPGKEVVIAPLQPEGVKSFGVVCSLDFVFLSSSEEIVGLP
jgi:hypothetical protein